MGYENYLDYVVVSTATCYCGTSGECWCTCNHMGYGNNLNWIDVSTATCYTQLIDPSNFSTSPFQQIE